MNHEKGLNTARPRLGRMSVLAAAMLLTVAAYSGSALATPPSGVSAQTLTVSALQEDVRAKFRLPGRDGFNTQLDVRNIVVVQYTVQPGGYFGWHSHSGPVWVAIQQGSLTLYDSADRVCGRRYNAGSAFMDAGEHVHNARNEGSEPTVFFATFMLPEGGPPRIDAPAPQGCSLPPLG